VQHLFSRQNRMLLAIAGVIVMSVLLMTAVYWSTDQQGQSVQNDDQRTRNLRALMGEFAAAIGDRATDLDDYLLSASAEPLSRFREHTATISDLAAQLINDADGLPTVQAATTAALEATTEWESATAEPAIAAVQGGGGAALAPYTDGSANDESATRAALASLDSQMVVQEQDVRSREQTLATARTAATALGTAFMMVAALVALWLVRRYGTTLQKDARDARVLNSFTEVTSFALDDTQVAASNLEALALLVHPDAGVTHVLNRSKDRAVPEAMIGSAIADVLPLNALSHCAGIVRGSMYVTSDASAPLSVHCPVYPATEGTVACLPLNSGEMVGAVHLYWERPNTLGLQERASVLRVVEHAALAIGTRRLLAWLRRQASTDPRTGLPNSRAYDQALEDTLNSRRSEEAVSVLMVDIDHFKDFNDRHGHPAGDEALRTFASVLQSCMRDDDLAARYGGEEFAVLLPGVDSGAARAIAERIRARTESTIVSLSPGITDRITVSIGIASAPTQALERVALLRLADEALYHAKEMGRNRVECLEPGDTVASKAVEPRPKRAARAAA